MMRIVSLLLNRLLCRENGNRSVSLGGLLQFYIIVLVITLLLCIFLLFHFLDIFSLPEENIATRMECDLNEYHRRLSSYFSGTAAQGIRLSEQVTREVERFLTAEDADFDDLVDNPDRILRLQENTYEFLHDALLIADCSGAFIIFDTTVNTSIPGAEHSRSGMYLRLMNITTPAPVNPDMVWLRGIASLGSSNNHFFHNHWELEFSLHDLPFYTKLKERASPDPAECFFYSPKVRLPGTWETMMLLCVPMVSRAGRFYGMCGLEISSMYFKLAHTVGNGDDLQLTGVAARRKEDWLLSATGLESGTSSGYFAGLDAEPLRVEPLSEGLNRYVSSSRSFVGLEKPVRLSPLFPGDNWVVASFLPEEDFKKFLRIRLSKTASVCIAFLLAAIGVSYWFRRSCITPLVHNIDAVKAGTAGQANILEIDDLIQFLSRQNMDEPTPSEVDMSGFYTFKENIGKLTPAERAVFNLYLEDFSAQKIADILCISINTVKSHNKRIYAKLGVSSRKELMIYIKMLKVGPEGAEGAGDTR